MNSFHLSLLQLAKHHLRNDRHEDAHALLDILATQGPLPPDAECLLAVSAQRCGLISEAISAYSRYLVHTPDDLFAKVNLAELYLNAMSIEHAYTLLRQVIDADPAIAHPAGYRARVLVMQAQEAL